MWRSKCKWPSNQYNNGFTLIRTSIVRILYNYNIFFHTYEELKKKEKEEIVRKTFFFCQNTKNGSYHSHNT